MGAKNPRRERSCRTWCDARWRMGIRSIDFLNRVLRGFESLRVHQNIQSWRGFSGFREPAPFDNRGFLKIY
jgi:hypothetical protein